MSNLGRFGVKIYLIEDPIYFLFVRTVRAFSILHMTKLWNPARKSKISSPKNIGLFVDSISNYSQRSLFGRSFFRQQSAFVCKLLSITNCKRICCFAHSNNCPYLMILAVYSNKTFYKTILYFEFYIPLDLKKVSNQFIRKCLIQLASYNMKAKRDFNT